MSKILRNVLAQKGLNILLMPIKSILLESNNNKKRINIELWRGATASIKGMKRLLANLTLIKGDGYSEIVHILLPLIALGFFH